MKQSLAAAVLLAGLVSAQENVTTLHSPLVVLPDDGPPFQKLFDFDGDGDMDAVGSRVYSDGTKHELRVWRNDKGKFVPYKSWAGPLRNGLWSRMGIAVGDFNKDGKDDFATAGGIWVHIYTSTGTGFSIKAVATVARAVELVAGDFDGDKSLDLAWNNDVTKQLTVRLATGKTYSVSGAITRHDKLLAMQLDGDAAMEIGVWTASSNQFEGFDLQSGKLVKILTLKANVGTKRWSYWANGDIDGDGDEDILAFELPSFTEPGRVHTFRRTGKTTFKLETPYVGGPAEFLADIDGDGDLDGVCCGGGGGGPKKQWPTLSYGSVFHLAINDRGRIGKAFRAFGKGSIRMAGVADVDKDGDVDLVAGACVFYGRGKWSPGSSPESGFDFSFTDKSNYARAMMDADRDGDVDVVPIDGSIRLNQGDGTFVESANSFTAAVPTGSTAGQPRFVGDFDGDGAPDAVVPLFDTNKAFVNMAFLKNNGSGSWRHGGIAANHRIGWGLSYADPRRGAHVADVDDDGDLDLIATSDPAYDRNARTEVHWNDGKGVFSKGPVFAGLDFLVAADFDGDKRTDIMLSTGYPGTIELRLGTGNATFGSPIKIPGPVPSIKLDPVTVVDVNDDGRLDFIVKAVTNRNPLQREMQIFCNTTTKHGQPTFAKSAVAFGANSSSQLHAMDVDGDRNTDLVLTHPVGGYWEMHIRRRVGGTGAVLQSTHLALAVRQVLHSGWPFDADGDGDKDLIGANVVRGGIHQGPTAGDIRQYGAGSPGEAKIAPVFGATGPFRAGETKELRLSGITGPTQALLVLGFAPASLPHFPALSVTCLVDPSNLIIVPWAVTARSDGHASALARMRIALPAHIKDVEAYEQVLILDRAAPGGVSASNGLFVRIGK